VINHSLIKHSVSAAISQAMKRPSSSSFANTPNSPPKKQKRPSSESENDISSQEDQNDPAVDEQWVKVEKRKAKKAKKLDAKFDVCVSHLFSPSLIHPAKTTQANPPRFLYSNSEILKRRDPVGINVRGLLSFCSCVITFAIRIFGTLSFTL
jgi:hypothetical protein